MTTQKMLQIQAKIVSNTQVAENYFKMCLDAPLVAQKAEPGQFIYIKTSNNYKPLLRRAFSIHSIGYRLLVIGYRQKRQSQSQKPNTLELLYKVRGIGTEILAEKKAGEELDIIGPLGKGFNIISNIKYQKSKIILIGGGIGIAPLVFLSEKLTKSKIKNQKSKITVLLGAETKEKILCKNDFEKLGCEVKIATEDGSQGFKGKVTELLAKGLLAISHLPASPAWLGGPFAIYACGPTPMLKEIAQISQRNKIPCQVSLEEKMACGIGACRGCVIKVKNYKDEENFIYKRVCKDGPVFDAQEIIW